MAWRIQFIIILLFWSQYTEAYWVKSKRYESHKYIFGKRPRSCKTHPVLAYQPGLRLKSYKVTDCTVFKTLYCENYAFKLLFTALWSVYQRIMTASPTLAKVKRSYSKLKLVMTCLYKQWMMIVLITLSWCVLRVP